MLGYYFFSLEIFLLFLLSRSLTRSLSSLFFRIFKSQRFAINLLAILFLPGVIIHELSHLLIAGLMFVPTGDIEFMPKISSTDGKKVEVKLGSVGIGKTDPIRRAIVGVAPFFVGMVIILSLMSVIARNEAISVFGIATLHFTSLAMTIPNWIIWAIVIYIIFVISNTMFSSKKDLEGIIELLIVFVIFLAILFIIGFRPPQLVWDYLFSQKVVSAVGRVDLLLLIPLLIDAIVIGGTKFLLKDHC